MIRQPAKAISQLAGVVPRQVIWEPVKNRPLVIRFGVMLAVAAALALGSPARGDTPLPASIPDLVGARSLSIGAYRGLSGGNDAIFTNAASLASRRRYSLTRS